MDEVLKAIDAALLARGLSDAAASRLAVGNPSLIKNLRNRRSTERDHPFENLSKLAAVLDLELYFGPRRRTASTTPEVVRFSETGPTSLQSPDARQFGYRTYPWHPDLQTKKPVPGALEPGVIAAIGVPDEQLCWVEPDWLAGDRLSDPLPGVLVDKTAARAGGPDWWCYRLDRKVVLGRLQFIPDRIIILGRTTADPVSAARIDDDRLRLLGRAVWIAAAAGSSISWLG